MMRQGTQMKLSRQIAVAGLLAVMAGCAFMPPEQDPLYPQMMDIDGRLARVERTVNNDGLVKLLSRIEAMEKDVQGLRNDIETLQYQVDQSNSRQKDLYLDIDKRLQLLEESTKDLNVLEGGSLNPGQLPVPGGTDRANYQAAFELLKQGRYDQASIALQQFMVAFPSSELSDNAQYWLAETHYVEQKYKKALPEFETVIKRFPNSRKIPDALLKIGFCHYELKQWNSARQALSTVATDYPETTAARLATQRLERMKTEGV